MHLVVYIYYSRNNFRLLSYCRYDAWEEFTGALNEAAPPGAARSAHTCDAWTIMIVETMAVGGALS